MSDKDKISHFFKIFEDGFGRLKICQKYEGKITLTIPFSVF